MESNAKPLAGKYAFIDLPNQKLEERELMIILYNLTGCLYSFAMARNGVWGEEQKRLYAIDSEMGLYQIMPEGNDGGFFDWYCDLRPYNQFFYTKESAVLHFINYWFQWKYAGLGEKISK